MASLEIEWKTSIVSDNQPLYLPSIEVEDHPLKSSHGEYIPRRILGSQPSTGRSSPVSTPSAYLQPLSDALEGLDPLTQFAREVDPLSKMNLEMLPSDSTDNAYAFTKKRESISSMHMQPWSARKNSILGKYTTSEKISFVSSFLPEGEKGLVKRQISAVDKVQHRLEQLDYFEEGSQRRLDLSQAEYVGKIELLNRELITAWNSEHRVKALKIAIQCAKVLAEIDVLRFYPSKFVLITDILDIFGQLVFERLRTKADYYRPGSKIATALPEDFTTSMVPESAKETCRNWFYKIASIRELVPRFYVETAILKSYSFLTSSEYSAALLRLSHMIRGIGNPLVAVYARCYLCRVGINITAPGTDNHYLKENFYDFLHGYEQVFGRYAMEELKILKLPLSTYLTLYSPALDFILQAVASTASDSLLSEIFKRCSEQTNSSLLLNTIIAAFKPSYISQRALQFVQLITQNSEEDFPQHILLRTLGQRILICPPSTEHRRQVMTTVWNCITQLDNTEHYIMCVEVWILYVVQHFMGKEVNAVLGDLVAHLSPKRAYEQHYNQLRGIINNILTHVQDFESLLAMDSFLPLLDLFQQDNIRIEVCKSILIACSTIQYTSDQVITNALMFLCGILHDSVNAFTVEDECRQISELLCGVINKVHYGRDFEQQLNFYVEARGAFSNLDTVLAQLVQCVNTLAVNTRQILKGRHTHKTSAFVRACAAYSFITIPSIVSVFTRLDLYMLSGQVALFNNCLGQADACFKAALDLIPDCNKMQKHCETFLVCYVKNLLSTLLVVPDSPDRGVLVLTRMLLNVLRTCEWDANTGSLACLYLSVLDMLSAMAQESYPYHIDNVESNDTLYGSDPKFINEINKVCTLVLGELLLQLKHLGPGRKQSMISLELVVKMVTLTDLRNESICNLALNLWNMCLKQAYIEVKYMARTKDYLKSRSSRTRNIAFQQLVDKFLI